MAFNLLPFLIVKNAARNLEDKNKKNLLGLLAASSPAGDLSAVVAPVALARTGVAEQDLSKAEQTTAEAVQATAQLQADVLTIFGQATKAINGLDESIKAPVTDALAKTIDPDLLVKIGLPEFDPPVGTAKRAVRKSAR